METSLNTTKLAQHDGNKPQHNYISATQWKQAATTKLAQHNGNKPQNNKISATQQKQATKQHN